MDNLERLVIGECKVIGNADLAFFTALGRDEDHSVRSPVSVDRTGCRILQDCYGSYVGRIDVAYGLFHTVDKDKRT